MESQGNEEAYKHSVWEIYRKEWAAANSEKRVELNKRMFRWQELMKDGLTANQAYYKAMEDDLNFIVSEELSDTPPGYSFWTKMRKAPFIILGLALVAAIVYCVIINGDKNALNAELESVRSVLSSTQSELSSTKEALTAMQADLSSTKETLASTQADLNSTKIDLASTQTDLEAAQAELSSTKQTLASTQADLSATKQTLTSVQSELGATKQELATTEAERLLYKETLDGLGVEVYSGRQPSITGGELVGSPNLKNNSIATNRTWGELKEFLLDDPTDDEYYSEFLFNCVSFAEMLHNNAEVAGIKAALVGVDFKGETIGHALNAFMTTDKGLVYVDCTGGTLQELLRERLYGYSIERDRIAYVMKGKKYCVLSIDTVVSPKVLHYEENYEEILEASEIWWVPGDIINSIEIYW